MVCFVCHIAILPNEFHEEVSGEYVRVLVESDIPGLAQIQFVPTPCYDEHCCLPAEEPEKVS